MVFSNASSDFRHKNFNYNYTSNTLRLLMSSLANLFGVFFAGKIWCSQVTDAEKKQETQNFPSKNVIWKLTQLPVFRRLKKITNLDPVWIFMVMSYCNSVSLGNLRLDAIQMKWLSSWWPLNIPAPKVHEKLSFSVMNHWPLFGATRFFVIFNWDNSWILHRKIHLC